MADPNNPSGALPGDPRYGLSEAELKEYYRTKSPTWIIRTKASPTNAEVRAAKMENHKAYLRASADRLRFSGPMLAEDGVTTLGGLSILDAPDRAAALAWKAAEPFDAAGGFSDTQITRWSSSMEMRQNDFPRREGWQYFAIFAWDGPDSTAKRKAVAEAHHKFQASVMDRYVARGPMFEDDGTTMIGSFMIMEFPDRAACDEFWAGEPLNYGGVFDRVEIQRWRYGKSLG
ncbi:MAG: YciI family protein [Alphaproteobacteria bacterium]